MKKKQDVTTIMISPDDVQNLKHVAENFGIMSERRDWGSISALITAVSRGWLEISWNDRLITEQNPGQIVTTALKLERMNDSTPGVADAVKFLADN